MPDRTLRQNRDHMLTLAQTLPPPAPAETLARVRRGPTSRLYYASTKWQPVAPGIAVKFNAPDSSSIQLLLVAVLDTRETPEEQHCSQSAEPRISYIILHRKSTARLFDTENIRVTPWPSSKPTALLTICDPLVVQHKSPRRPNTPLP